MIYGIKNSSFESTSFLSRSAVSSCIIPENLQRAARAQKNVCIKYKQRGDPRLNWGSADKQSNNAPQSYTLHPKAPPWQHNDYKRNHLCSRFGIDGNSGSNLWASTAILSCNFFNMRQTIFYMSCYQCNIPRTWTGRRDCFQLITLNIWRNLKEKIITTWGVGKTVCFLEHKTKQTELFNTSWLSVGGFP